MTVSPAAKVGAIILAALIVFVGVVWFLKGFGLRRSLYQITVAFDDSMGLAEGSSVRMAGVAIGQVSKIGLDENQRAIMEMDINKAYRIPIGSRFILQVGLLVGDKFVNIIPNRKATRYLPPGALVYGEQTPRLEELLPKAEKLMSSLSKTSESLRTVLANPEYQQRIGSILKQLDESAASLRIALARADEITRKLNSAASTLQGATIEERENIHAIVQNVLAASRSLNELTAELRDIAENGSITANLEALLEAGRKAAENLEKSTASMEKLVTSPEFQEDLRETAKGAREAVAGARAAIERINQLLGVKKTTGTGSRTEAPQTREAGLDVLVEPEGSKTRATLSGSFGLGDRFLKLGLYDVGVTNKLILQPGRALDANTDFRYGLYAARLGVGLDYELSDRWFGSLNLYNPQDVTLDILSGYRISDDWGLLVGVDDLFDENKIAVGARFTR